MKQLIVTIVIMVVLSFVAANAVLDGESGLALILGGIVWLLLPVAFRQSQVAERREARLNGR